MPIQQAGKHRRKNGKLAKVCEPASMQRYGAHAVHPGKTGDSKHITEAPAAAPSKASSAAKSSTPVKGDSDASATT